MSDLTHVDASGHARMVDVGDKAATDRRAVAIGRVRMSAQAFATVRDHAAAKGDVLGVARVAGIQGAKRTADLIPLCHQLPLAAARVDLTLDPELPGVRCEAEMRTVAGTGVEMEALTAVSVALLTVYDMLKAVDPAMELGEIRLVQKSGGRRNVSAR